MPVQQLILWSQLVVRAAEQARDAKRRPRRRYRPLAESTRRPRAPHAPARPDRTAGRSNLLGQFASTAAPVTLVTILHERPRDENLVWLKYTSKNR